MAQQTQVSESGHWYEADGKPAYTIISKNGVERNTTLRDAKKLGLLPSVTTIIRCAAAPGLELWKSQQVLMAALTTDRKLGETEQEYISRIISDSQEQAAKARERGTLIHAWVQTGFEGGAIPQEGADFFKSANDELIKHTRIYKWDCELPFAAGRYGGKVDLQGFGSSGSFIVDIKTTEKDLTDIKTRPEHAWQLAAYDYKELYQHHGILYINTIIKEAKLILIKPEEIEKGRKCFNALLDFYYAKTGL